MSRKLAQSNLGYKVGDEAILLTDTNPNAVSGTLRIVFGNYLNLISI